MLSGDIDFLLKCVAPDVVTFQNFIIRELTRCAERQFRQDSHHDQDRETRARAAGIARVGEG